MDTSTDTRRQTYVPSPLSQARIDDTILGRVPLDHDYGDDATILANFLTADGTLRQQAAITLLCMAVRAERPLPVVDEDAVDVCAAAILDVTRVGNGLFSPSVCATLAHLACRAFARHQLFDQAGPVAQHALLAIGEAAAAVIEG